MTGSMDSYFRSAGYGVRTEVMETGDEVFVGWAVFDLRAQIEGDDGCWRPTRMAVWRWWRDRISAHQDDEELALLIRKGCQRESQSAMKALAWAQGKGENIPDLVRSYYRMRDLRGPRRKTGWIKEAPAIARRPGFADGPQSLILRACAK